MSKKDKKKAKQKEKTPSVDPNKLFAAGMLVYGRGKKLPTPYATIKEAFERALAWGTMCLVRCKPDEQGRVWQPMKLGGVVLFGPLFNQEMTKANPEELLKQEKVKEFILSGKADQEFQERRNSIIFQNPASSLTAKG